MPKPSTYGSLTPKSGKPVVGPRVTGKPKASGHPHKNLGKFLHPTKKR